MGNFNTNAYDEDQSLVVLNYTSAIAAGSDLTISPPGHSRLKLVALSFLFTTSAAAADRLIKVKCVRGGVDYMLTSAGQIQTASLALRYYFMVSGALSDIVNPKCYHAPLPDAFLFLSGDTLDTEIDNIQLLDQITEVTYVWKVQPRRD